MSPPGYKEDSKKNEITMKRALILLLTATLAGCTERELSAPDAPLRPDGKALIVPNAIMGTSVSGEATTKGATRAVTYPYAAKNANGLVTVLVTADEGGQLAGAKFHRSWTEAPQHDELSPDNSLSARLEVAPADIGYKLAVTWDDANDNYCTTPWRLPTHEELKFMKAHISKLAGVNRFFDGFYWSTTEKSGNSANAWYVDAGLTAPNHRRKDIACYARCVRDAYPYIDTNADGKANIIVSQDEYGSSGAAIHVPWLQSPVHDANTTEGDKIAKSVSPRFEVSVSDGSPVMWTNNNYGCNSPWRRPTEAELLLVYKMYSEGGLSDVNDFVRNQFYHTSTVAGSKMRYIRYLEEIYNAGQASAYIRCIRDAHDAFPTTTAGAFWMTAYAGTDVPTEGWNAPYFVINEVNYTDPKFVIKEPQYYPADPTKKLYFYAFAPVWEVPTAATNTTPPLIDYTIDGQKDVMWAKDVQGIAKSTDPAKQQQPWFLFQRKLMQLKFVLVKDDSFAATSPKVTSIKVKNTRTAASLNVVTGELTFSGTADKTVQITPTTGNTITAAPGTMLAQTLMIEPTDKVTLSVTAGGVTSLDFTLTDLSAKAGTSHTVTLTFKRQAISATATLAGWSAVQPGDVDVDKDGTN